MPHGAVHTAPSLTGSTATAMIAVGTMCRRAAILIPLLLLAGCGGRTALLQPADADHDSRGTVSRRDGARDAALHDTVRRHDAGCYVLLSVGAVKPQPSYCWIDQKVGNRSATLEWSCASGEAEAGFAVPFVGTVTGGIVSLTATTLFSWSDGCTWQSRQTIDGSLASGSLTYRYSEQPIKGTGCAPAVCTATEPVLVH